MNKVIKRIFKDNFMISLPTLVISVFLIIFLIIGLSTKDSDYVTYKTTLLEEQAEIENTYSKLNSLTEKAAIDDPIIILNPYSISPLTALVIFSTDDAQSVKIVVKGKTEAADFEYQSEVAVDHYIPIYGLYPGYLNIIELSIVDELDNVSTYTIEINTSALPENINLPENIDTTYEYFEDNLMLFNSSDSNPVGYDFNGDVRWYLTENFFSSIDILDNNHLLVGTDRDLFKSNFKTGLYEIDFLGKIYTEYVLPNGYTGNLLELDNANLLISTNSDSNGNNDTIIELSKEFGFVIRKLEMSSIFDNTEGKNLLWSINNDFDISGIAYDKNTNSIFVSSKALDVVLNIDYQTFTLNYVIGDPTNFNQDLVDEYFLSPLGLNFEWQYAQSDIDILENGDIIIFDNGYQRTKNIEQSINIINSYSRAVIYRVDEDNKTIEQIFEFGKGFELGFYSLYNGNVKAYSDNNYLIHSGNINTVNFVPINTYPVLYDGASQLIQKSKTYEIEDGNVMYKIDFNNNYDHAIKVNMLENISFSFGSNYLGRFEATNLSDIKLDSKVNIFDKVPNRYNLTLIEEKDRLVLTGDFNPEDEVYLILESNLISINYNIPTTKDLLSNIFKTNYLNEPTIFYITNNGLSSEYYIYISINQVKYNTYLKINFKD